MGGPGITGLPGPKEVRYWVDADLNKLRQAILDISAWGATVDLLTAKGDLLTRDSDSYARVPVGSNEQVLVADSTDAEGIKWRALFPIPTTVWDDVLGEVQPGLSVSAPVVEGYRDTVFRTYHFQHNQDDDLSIRFQLPHRWKPDTECRLHVHWVPCVNPASTEYVVWEATFSWAHYGIDFPAAASWTTVEARATVGTSDAWKPTITALVATTPTTDSVESSFLCVRVRRLGTTAPTTPGWTDTYTTGKAVGVPPGTAAANVAFLSCDLHFQAEKLGTATEIPI